MYSNTLEITGLGLVAWGVAVLLGAAAGLIVAGVELVFLGAVTDDAAVSATVRRGVAWLRYRYWRQVARENGQIPEDSPHPPIYVDPEMEDLAARLAAERVRRGNGRRVRGVP